MLAAVLPKTAGYIILQHITSSIYFSTIYIVASVIILLSCCVKNASVKNAIILLFTLCHRVVPHL